jgi:hypothetical protein
MFLAGEFCGFPGGFARPVGGGSQNFSIGMENDFPILAWGVSRADFDLIYAFDFAIFFIDIRCTYRVIMHRHENCFAL